MATVKLYGAGWLVLVAALVVAVLSGHQSSAFSPWALTGLLWLAAGCKMLAAPDEWATFVRYWGWIMNAGGIDKHSTFARGLFGGGTILLGLLTLAIGVGGVLALLGYDELSERLLGG